MSKTTRVKKEKSGLMIICKHCRRSKNLNDIFPENCYINNQYNSNGHEFVEEMRCICGHGETCHGKDFCSVGHCHGKHHNFIKE